MFSACTHWPCSHNFPLPSIEPAPEMSDTAASALALVMVIPKPGWRARWCPVKHGKSRGAPLKKLGKLSSCSRFMETITAITY